MWAVSPPMKSEEAIKCSRRGTSGGFFCSINLAERVIFAHKNKAGLILLDHAKYRAARLMYKDFLEIVL